MGVSGGLKSRVALRTNRAGARSVVPAFRSVLAESDGTFFSASRIRPNSRVRRKLSPTAIALKRRAKATHTVYGNKGATIQHPGWGGNDVGFLPFPVW